MDYVFCKDLVHMLMLLDLNKDFSFKLTTMHLNRLIPSLRLKLFLLNETEAKGDESSRLQKSFIMLNVIP